MTSKLKATYQCEDCNRKFNVKANRGSTVEYSCKCGKVYEIDMPKLTENERAKIALQREREREAAERKKQIEADRLAAKKQASADVKRVARIYEERERRKIEVEKPKEMPDAAKIMLAEQTAPKKSAAAAVLLNLILPGLGHGRLGLEGASIGWFFVTIFFSVITLGFAYPLMVLLSMAAAASDAQKVNRQLFQKTLNGLS
jgi:hypothetical protein